MSTFSILIYIAIYRWLDSYSLSIVFWHTHSPGFATEFGDAGIKARFPGLCISENPGGLAGMGSIKVRLNCMGVGSANLLQTYIDRSEIHSGSSL